MIALSVISYIALQKCIINKRGSVELLFDSLRNSLLFANLMIRFGFVIYFQLFNHFIPPFQILKEPKWIRCPRVHIIIQQISFVHEKLDPSKSAVYTVMPIKSGSLHGNDVDNGRRQIVRWQKKKHHSPMHHHVSLFLCYSSDTSDNKHHVLAKLMQTYPYHRHRIIMTLLLRYVAANAYITIVTYRSYQLIY